MHQWPLLLNPQHLTEQQLQQMLLQYPLAIQVNMMELMIQQLVLQAGKPMMIARMMIPIRILNHLIQQ